MIPMQLFLFSSRLRLFAVEGMGRCIHFIFAPGLSS